MLNTINKPSIKGTRQVRDESNHRSHPFFLSCLRFGAAHLVLEGSTQQSGHTHKLRPLDKPLQGQPLQGWSWGECGLSLGWRKRGQWSASFPELGLTRATSVQGHNGLSLWGGRRGQGLASDIFRQPPHLPCAKAG